MGLGLAELLDTLLLGLIVPGATLLDTLQELIEAHRIVLLRVRPAHCHERCQYRGWQNLKVLH